MSTIFVCDGCGKQTEPRQSEFKPNDWFEASPRVDNQRITLHACSRPCIEAAAKKFNVSPVVLPI